MENIKIKRVVFNTGAGDFIYSCVDWYANGGYNGFLKDNCMSILDIKKVVDDIIPEKDYYSLPSWEG